MNIATNHEDEIESGTKELSAQRYIPVPQEGKQTRPPRTVVFLMPET